MEKVGKGLVGRDGKGREEKRKVLKGSNKEGTGRRHERKRRGGRDAKALVGMEWNGRRERRGRDGKAKGMAVMGCQFCDSSALILTGRRREGMGGMGGREEQVWEVWERGRGGEGKVWEGSVWE